MSSPVVKTFTFNKTGILVLLIILMDYTQSNPFNKPKNNNEKTLLQKNFQKKTRVAPTRTLEINLDQRLKSNYFYTKNSGQEQKLIRLTQPCFFPKDIQVPNNKIDPHTLEIWNIQCLHWLQGQSLSPGNYRQTNLRTSMPHHKDVRLASNSDILLSANLNTNTKISKGNKSFNILTPRTPGFKHQRKELIKGLDRNFHSFLFSRKRKEKSNEQPNKIQSLQPGIGSTTFTRPAISLAPKIQYRSPSAFQYRNMLINSDYSSPKVKFNLDIGKKYESFPFQERKEPLFNYEDIFHFNNITYSDPGFDEKKKLDYNEGRFSLNEYPDFGQEFPEMSSSEQYYYEETNHEPYYHEENLDIHPLKQDKTSEGKHPASKNQDISSTSTHKLLNETYSVSENNYLSRSNDASIRTVSINDKESGKNEKNSRTGSNIHNKDGAKRLNVKPEIPLQNNEPDSISLDGRNNDDIGGDGMGPNHGYITENLYSNTVNKIRKEKTIASEKNEDENQLKNSLRLQIGSTSRNNDGKISKDFSRAGFIIRSSNEYLFHKLLKNWIDLKLSVMNKGF